ncbi:hypothetical protein [Pelagicoccus sp. SDUM812003]|uniref:hypothetical protein n=1 Tax=Pelagicoccus sp. SDUM812003 TaxID=3041267 RepID=UPI00280E5227|nr:hypothetical protein [Pelagicoccus sp. SDUM812003]MDQ8205734.1 hypothetical protein [Pelagicoccus sp. SDUM812003]
MKCVFIDETSDSKFKSYHGLSIASVDSRFYPNLKEQFQSKLISVGWDPSIEFKGSYIFSKKSGDTNVDVPERVELAREVIALNKSKSNSRMKFHYSSCESDDSKKAYLSQIEKNLPKAIGKPSKGTGKNLLSLHFDQRSDVTIKELRDLSLPILSQKGWKLYEDISIASSGFQTIGILFADIVGYMQARIETISSDAELFDGLDLFNYQRNGKIRKLNTSTEIIDGIKTIEVKKIG